MTRIFGTDGVRGIANEELTPELAFQLGKAGAFVLTEGAHKPTILVGKDTRISGDMLEAAMMAGILSAGANVIPVGVIPTPAIAYLTRKYKADAGVMISASHNPVEFNGIKFFDQNGLKLSDRIEDQIQAIIENKLEGTPAPTGGGLGRIIHETSAEAEYVEFAAGTLENDLRGLRVAVDCANGAASRVAVSALRKLGAEVYVINDNPDGLNINKDCGSTHMDELKHYVVEKNCDLGLAFDGDADRCLAVDEAGRIVNGDFIMLICALDLKRRGKLHDDTLVVTVMSNLGLKLACEAHGVKIEQTKVGDRYVLENMIRNQYSLGGEQSGHVIFLEHNTTGDGLVTGLALASIVHETGQKLSELAGVMKELPQVLVNVRVRADKKTIHESDPQVIEKIREMEAVLHGQGRVLIRPSGTEPLLRIMLEGEDQSEIDRMAHELADLIKAKCK
ncbi:phosphoglucosamine mutase [Clostridiaceae bacterium HFYG-1003]|nr:phosphoglucosamine mutase [Clostridiaceae bacterium HFYG-1003]